MKPCRECRHEISEQAMACPGVFVHSGHGQVVRSFTELRREGKL